MLDRFKSKIRSLGPKKPRPAVSVGRIMARGVLACGPDDTLSRAAQIMWEKDCGFVPVVDPQGLLVGVLTDRDVCMATFTRGVPPEDVPVSEVMATNIQCCRAWEPLDEVVERMRLHRVRRLPVVDSKGHLDGVLSVNDLAVEAYRSDGTIVSLEEVGATLAAISQHRISPSSEAN